MFDFNMIVTVAVFGPLILLPLPLALIWFNRDRPVPAGLALVLVLFAGLGLVDAYSHELGLPNPYDPSDLPAWRHGLAVVGDLLMLWIALLAGALLVLVSGRSRSPNARALGWGLAGFAGLAVVLGLALSGLRFN